MSEIIPLAKSYVQQLLTQLPESHYYHDWKHTQEVYDEASHLGVMAKLSEDQMEHLQLAALFHDTGFVKSYEDHETNSKAIAAEYLQSIDYPPDQIRMIQEVIEATRMPQKPTDKVGALLQDADLASLGSTTWETRSDLLRKELFAVLQKEYTDAEWVRYNMDFFKQTVYQTMEGKSKYDAIKDRNRDELKEKNKSLKKEQIKSLISGNRTADMLFKTALRNHISLTQIADNKANIMLTLNALILTFALPILFKSSSSSDYTIYSMIITGVVLGVACVISMIYAALATQPGKFKGKFNLDDIQAGKGSLFFSAIFIIVRLKNIPKE
ncbi:MAG: HD domain-containing protein [Saprospiraceae bacterium]|nr:HD domain-containing protein [Saprospiraceae bacterium]